jgi:RNA polymerase sigma-70 factor (ECF subfamily)
MYGVMTDAAGSRLASYYGEIYSFVRRRARSSRAAEDLTQQVFTDAAAALKRYGEESGGSLGLLFTIARRRLIDELRASELDLVNLDEVREIAVPVYEPTLGRDIAAAIERLDSEQRQLVGLKLLRGLTFAETAAILGVSEGACKMRFRSALEILRRDLQSMGVHR